ncbi:uncharacterized protein [Haliotis asinina]|uniref:uncharacterized protein n=1 Tax=Haliotis asinina TaxID=109174 RepID=UPI0035323111
MNTDDCDELLNYLEQYTSGEAKSIVSSYGYLNADKGYPAAMKELKERYGDGEIIVSAFIEKALDWPTIKPDDPKALDKFTVFLSECEHAVESDVLDNKENLKRLVMKLPYSHQEKFRALVQSLRDIGEPIKFANLVCLLKRE